MSDNDDIHDLILTTKVYLLERQVEKLVRAGLATPEWTWSSEPAQTRIGWTADFDRPAGPHRDALVKHLKDHQIGVEVYYPLCLHEQECFKFLGYRSGDFPESETAATGVLALPMFPEITEAQQVHVIDTCSAYLRQSLRKAA